MASACLLAPNLLLQETPLLRQRRANGRGGHGSKADAAAVAWGKRNTSLALKCILSREKDRPPESKRKRIDNREHTSFMTSADFLDTFCQHLIVTYSVHDSHNLVCFWVTPSPNHCGRHM